MKIKDPVIVQLIKQFGELPELQEVDIYQDIIETIIGQQLSVKAAATIRNRFLELFGGTFPNPQRVLDTPDDVIRACGISYSKIKYIKGFCQAIINKEIDLEKLRIMSDGEVLEELIKLKGIGKWTAEMILIFTLKRPDIFSMGDLGLRTAVGKLYNIDRDDTLAIEQITQQWSPYRSSASRYLWMSLDNAPKK